MRPKILIVGSMNMDLCMYGLGGLPAWGTSTFAKEYRYATGGKGANQAFAVSRLGGEAYMAGRIGNDENGRLLMESLQSKGVDTTYVVQDPDNNTGLCTMNMEAEGQYFSIYVPGANMALCEGDVLAALDAHRFDMILMQLEMPLELVYRICALGRERQIPIFLDAGPAMRIPLDKLRGTLVISPNEAETEALTGIAPTTEAAIEAAAKRIYEEAAPQYVLLKLGKRGAYLYTGEKGEIIPGFKVNAIDTTAAGDTFSAAFCVGYSEGKDIREAIRYAHAAAAICVTRKGGQPSIPEKREADEFFRAYGP